MSNKFENCNPLVDVKEDIVIKEEFIKEEIADVDYTALFLSDIKRESEENDFESSRLQMSSEQLPCTFMLKNEEVILEDDQENCVAETDFIKEEVTDKDYKIYLPIVKKEGEENEYENQAYGFVKDDLMLKNEGESSTFADINEKLEESDCKKNDNLENEEDEKPFKCDACDRSYKCFGSLRVHQARHLKIKSFSCSKCRMKFTQRSRLLQHEKTHSAARRFVCSVCKRSFKTLRVLKRHESMHSVARPYLRDICDKSYRHLSNHMLIDSMERSFECDVCGENISDFRFECA